MIEGYNLLVIHGSSVPKRNSLLQISLYILWWLARTTYRPLLPSPQLYSLSHRKSPLKAI